MRSTDHGLRAGGQRPQLEAGGCGRGRPGVGWARVDYPRGVGEAMEGAPAVHQTPKIMSHLLPHLPVDEGAVLHAHVPAVPPSTPNVRGLSCSGPALAVPRVLVAQPGRLIPHARPSCASRRGGLPPAGCLVRVAGAGGESGARATGLPHGRRSAAVFQWSRIPGCRPGDAGSIPAEGSTVRSSRGGARMTPFELSAGSADLERPCASTRRASPDPERSE